MSLQSRGVRTLLVSPHQDDIALSLGGSILTGIFAKPMAILNVFTTSRYAPHYEGHHDETSVSRVRAGEDRRFAERLGLIHLELGLKDAELRWNLNQDTFPLLKASSLVRGWPPPNSRSMRRLGRRLSRMRTSTKGKLLQNIAKFDRTYDLVKKGISRVVSEFPDATVVSPISLASQPDHVIVACACKAVKTSASGKIFYEDLPYAWRFSLGEIQEQVGKFDRTLKPRLVDISSVFDIKMANLGLYQSQLGAVEIEAVANHSKRLVPRQASERLWSR